MNKKSNETFEKTANQNRASSSFSSVSPSQDFKLHKSKLKRQPAIMCFLSLFESFKEGQKNCPEFSVSK